MSTPSRLWAGSMSALALSMVIAQPVQAEPLTPLTQAENTYLEQVRKVLTASHNTAAFRSDGELLVHGRFACEQRANHGMVGEEASLTPSAVNQLAFIYLCPS